MLKKYFLLLFMSSFFVGEVVNADCCKKKDKCCEDKCEKNKCCSTNTSSSRSSRPNRTLQRKMLKAKRMARKRAVSRAMRKAMTHRIKMRSMR